jgi:hypothetical protein
LVLTERATDATVSNARLLDKFVEAVAAGRLEGSHDASHGLVLQQILAQAEQLTSARK